MHDAVEALGLCRWLGGGSLSARDHVAGSSRAPAAARMLDSGVLRSCDTDVRSAVFSASLWRATSAAVASAGEKAHGRGPGPSWSAAKREEARLLPIRLSGLRARGWPRGSRRGVVGLEPRPDGQRLLGCALRGGLGWCARTQTGRPGHRASPGDRVAGARRRAPRRQAGVDDDCSSPDVVVPKPGPVQVLLSWQHRARMSGGVGRRGAVAKVRLMGKSACASRAARPRRRPARLQERPAGRWRNGDEQEEEEVEPLAGLETVKVYSGSMNRKS